MSNSTPSFPQVNCPVNIWPSKPESQKLLEGFVRQYWTHLGLSRKREFSCPHLLAGLRCRPYECLLQASPLFDHPESFCVPRFGPRGVLLVSHPYYLDSSAHRTIALMEDLGLKVKVTADSWYYPGHSLLVVVHAADFPRASLTVAPPVRSAVEIPVIGAGEAVGK